MRFLGAFFSAILAAFVVFWVASQLAGIIEQPDLEHNDFTVGERMMLCGFVVESRHKEAGYDFDEWQGSRCDNLSRLDECLLDCLSRARSIERGEACYSHCVKEKRSGRPFSGRRPGL